MDIGAKAFAERMEQFTGGRIKIQIFPGGALGNALKVPETVKNGIAELRPYLDGLRLGQGPDHGALRRLRRLVRHRAHAALDLRGAAASRCSASSARSTDGIISMPLFIRTAEVFLHSRKPVKTLADLKGLKIRTAGAWLEMAKDLGAAPVTTAGGDVYPMLERGAIDATEWGTLWENITPRLLQGGEVPDLSRRAPADRAVRAVHQQGRLGQALRRPTSALIETVAKLVTFESWLAHRPGGRQGARLLQEGRATTSSSSTRKCSTPARKIGARLGGQDAQGQSLVRQGAQEPAGVRDAVEGRRALAQGEGERLTVEARRARRGAARRTAPSAFPRDAMPCEPRRDGRHSSRDIERVDGVSVGIVGRRCAASCRWCSPPATRCSRATSSARPTIWAYEIGYMLTGSHFLLGMAFTLRERRAHPHRHLQRQVLAAHPRGHRPRLLHRPAAAD